MRTVLDGLERTSSWLERTFSWLVPWSVTGAATSVVARAVYSAVTVADHVLALAWVAIALGWMATAAFTWRRLYRRPAGAPKVTAPARCLTRMAVFLVGPKQRAALRAEWASHLSGETGAGLPSRRQARDALGFVASAIRCRCSDAADAAWTPVDAVLKSRTLSNLFTLVPTALTALILFLDGGIIGLLGRAESVSAIYLALYALVLAGRKYRDLKPPEPRARRAKELLPGSAAGCAMLTRTAGN
jgi:hypothetical protein